MFPGRSIRMKTISCAQVLVMDPIYTPRILAMFVILPVVSLLLGANCSKPAGDPAGQKMFIRGTDIRIRSAPSTDAAILGVAQGGMVVDVIEKVGSEVEVAGRRSSWYRIRLMPVTLSPSGESEVEGFVFGAFLVSKSEGPDAMMSEAEKLGSTDPDRAIALFHQIRKEFPVEGEPVLYERGFLIDNAISVLQCWKAKRSSANSKEALIADLRTGVEQNDRMLLRERSSCVFLQWEAPCAGDPVPGPMSERDLEEFQRMAAGFDWKRFDGECVVMNDGNKKYCFSIEDYRGGIYWAGGCIEGMREKRQ